VNKYSSWTTEQLMQALDDLDRTTDEIEEPMAGDPIDSWFRRLYKIQVDLVRLSTELARRTA